MKSIESSDPACVEHNRLTLFPFKDSQDLLPVLIKIPASI
jgi:hypothetical protein